MTKKKHEELVEEITAELEDIARFSITDECFPSRQEYLRDVAQRFMTLILFAIRDGRLDEELGVVGRGDLVWGNYGIIHSWDAPPIEPLNQKEPYHRFIALRPLTGTGKEEE